MCGRKRFFRLLVGLVPFAFTCGAARAFQLDKVVKFEKPVNISRNKNRIETQAAIAVDKNGIAHIAWAGYYSRKGAPNGVASDIYYSNNKTGSFGSPQKIPVSADWYSTAPSIAVDSKGSAHIVFCRRKDQINLTPDDDLYYASNVNGRFAPPVLIVGCKPGDDESGPSDPILHIDSENRPRLSFLLSTFHGVSGQHVVIMNKSTGKWSVPQLAYKASGLLYGYESRIDGDGYFHVVLGVLGSNPDSGIYYTHNRGGDFIRPAVVQAGKHKETGDPSLAVDSLGRAHVTYRDDTGAFGTPRLFYTNNISGKFSAPLPMPNSDRLHFSGIDIDGHDFVHVTYKLLPLNGEGMMYYANNYTGKFVETAQKMTGIWWFHGSRFFTAGSSFSVHYGFWDFMGDVYTSDCEVFYLKGTCERPAVPINPGPLAVAAFSASGIRLKWQDRSTIESGYEVQRKTKAGGKWTKISRTKADINTYLDQGLSARTAYLYRVRAFNAAGNSLYSNTAQGKTK